MIFTPRYPPYGGGSSIYSSTLIDELSDEVEFMIITFQHSECRYLSLEKNSTVYRIIPDTSDYPAIIRLIIESIVSFVLSLYIIVNNDVLVSHIHMGSFATPGVMLSNIICQKSKIYDCRDEMFPSSILRVGNPKIIFSCSSSVDEHIIGGGINPQKIIRVPVVNPPYIDEYKSETSEENSFNVVFIGRIIEEKGVQTLLEAFTEFNQTHTESRLTLIGDDPEGIASSYLETNSSAPITYLGELPHKEVLKVLSQSDTLVLPSTSEGMPRVIIEAFELGIPVISTPVGEVKHLIEHNESGLIIEDKNDLVESLERLKTHPKLYDKISQKEVEVSKRWSWKSVSKQILHWYRK